MIDDDLFEHPPQSRPSGRKYVSASDAASNYVELVTNGGLDSMFVRVGHDHPHNADIPPSYESVCVMRDPVEGGRGCAHSGPLEAAMLRDAFEAARHDRSVSDDQWRVWVWSRIYSVPYRSIQTTSKSSAERWAKRVDRVVESLLERRGMLATQQQRQTYRQGVGR